MSKRPEHQAPPDIYYNDVEAEKYTKNSRIIEIQTKMTERAVEILQLPEDESCFLLDIGCGSGLSGEYLTEIGHTWVGLDISKSMLNVAVDREVEGDLFLSDAGQGMFFRPGTFDGVISISAIQWLCNADKTTQNPVKRLYKFFSTLYASMRRGTKAVFQLYPESPDQLELITQQATKAGFGGGVVVDFPNSTKAKKIFLCLFCGLPASATVPKGLGAENSNQINNTNKRMRFSEMKGKSLKKSRDWIIEKKERRMRQGRSVRPTTKYTGRKRKTKF